MDSQFFLNLQKVEYNYKKNFSIFFNFLNSGLLSPPRRFKIKNSHMRRPKFVVHLDMVVSKNLHVLCVRSSISTVLTQKKTKK
jgi:hypothetical protein